MKTSSLADGPGVVVVEELVDRAALLSAQGREADFGFWVFHFVRLSKQIPKKVLFCLMLQMLQIKNLLFVSRN